MVNKINISIEETKKMCDEQLISLNRICRLCVPNYKKKQSKGGKNHHCAQN